MTGEWKGKGLGKWAEIEKGKLLRGKNWERNKKRLGE